MKVVLIAISFAGLFGCDVNHEQNSNSAPELTAQQIADSVSNLTPDGNQTTAGKSFSLKLDGPVESENLSIALWHPGKFEIDSNLNYYLPVKLTNKLSVPVIGVSLRRDEYAGIYYELGKFKINIKPHGSAKLKLSLKVLKLDKSILEKVWTMGHIVASEVYYADGTHSSETITIEPSTH